MTSIAPTVVDSIFCYLYAIEVPILTSTKPSLGLIPSQSAQAFGTVSALSNEVAREDLYNVVELISASKLVSLSKGPILLGNISDFILSVGFGRPYCSGCRCAFHQIAAVRTVP